jgi:hypothetical protein
MMCVKCPAKLISMRDDANMRKALVIRLKTVLDKEIKSYEHSKNYLKDKLSATAFKDLDRKHRQRIQSLENVISMLTPGDRFNVRYWRRK